MLRCTRASLTGMHMFAHGNFYQRFVKRDLNSVSRCGLQSSRQEEFSNLSLALTAGSSVEACLQQYLQVRSSRYALDYSN